jgi:hypothetical protein
LTASRPPQNAAGVNRRVRLSRIRLRPRADRERQGLFGTGGLI